jgi:hypothetical protein
MHYPVSLQQWHVIVNLFSVEMQKQLRQTIWKRMATADLVAQRINAFIEKEGVDSAETIEEALGEQVDQALIGNALEVPSAGPTRDPMEDTAASDDDPELELLGEDELDDEAEEDVEDAFQQCQFCQAFFTNS